MGIEQMAQERLGALAWEAFVHSVQSHRVRQIDEVSIAVAAEVLKDPARWSRELGLVEPLFEDKATVLADQMHTITKILTVQTNNMEQTQKILADLVTILGHVARKVGA